MKPRKVWVLALGLGMVAVPGPLAGQAFASPTPLCIGPGGAFVACGVPGQQVVLPPATTVHKVPPVSSTTPATTPASTPPASTRPAPTTATPPATRVVVRASSGDSTSVMVLGVVAGVLLLLALAGLAVAGPVNMPLPARGPRVRRGVQSRA